jgi:hypothetical protein
MSLDAAGRSACATWLDTACLLELWRRYSSLPRPQSCGRLCVAGCEKSGLIMSQRGNRVDAHRTAGWN